MYNYVLSPINPETLIDEISNRVSEKILKVINNENTVTGNEWLNLTELCNYLPEKPSKATVYGWVHLKKIPYYKKGKALFFKKSEIDTWLQGGSKNSTFEPTNVLKQKK